MVGNSKNWWESEILKKWRKNTSAVAINTIRQKERNKINLNLLNYFKRYLHRDYGKNDESKNYFLNSYVVCVVAHIVWYKTTT